MWVKELLSISIKNMNIRVQKRGKLTSFHRNEHQYLQEIVAIFFVFKLSTVLIDWKNQGRQCKKLEAVLHPMTQNYGVVEVPVH